MEILQNRRDVTGGWRSGEDMCCRILYKLHLVESFLRKTTQKEAAPAWQHSEEVGMDIGD